MPLPTEILRNLAGGRTNREREVMQMKPKTIEELETELARQDDDLSRAMSAFQETAGDARFELPPGFVEDLEQLCSPSPTFSSHVPTGLRA